MEDKIWRVYTHTTPEGLKYVGMTSMKLNRRWKPWAYKGTSLEPYIEQYGFDNLIHEVIYTCYDRKEALEVEDEMMMFYREKEICINEQRSGFIYKSDLTSYRRNYRRENKDKVNEWYRNDYKENPEKYRSKSKKYRQNHLEKEKERVRENARKFRSTPEGKIYSRVTAYNQKHPDNITITPMEAKFEYVNYSFVPSFIKYDDIPNALPIIPSDWEWCKNLN